MPEGGLATRTQLSYVELTLDAGLKDCFFFFFPLSHEQGIWRQPGAQAPSDFPQGHPSCVAFFLILTRWLLCTQISHPHSIRKKGRRIEGRSPVSLSESRLARKQWLSLPYPQTSSYSHLAHRAIPSCKGHQQCDRLKETHRCLSRVGFC